MGSSHVVHLTGAVRAAVAVIDITDLVSLETRGKHRGPASQPGRLTGRVLLFHDGERELLLIALDLLELYQPWMDRFKKALSLYVHVAPENMIVWCNHIHAASNSDGIAEVPLADRLAWAIEKARGEYETVEVAYAGRELGRGWTIRRRFDIDDLETFCVMFNDGCRVEGDRLEVSQQVRSYLLERGVDPAVWSGAGRSAYVDVPGDTRLELVSVRSARDGRPLASVLRFAAHPVIASHSKIGNALYPDYVGALRSEFERRFGSTAIFLQGSCGDVRPMHEQYGVDAAAAYGKRLAREAGKLVKGLRYQTLDRVGAAISFADLQLRPEYKWSLDRLRAEREKVAGRLAHEKDARKRLMLSRRDEVLGWVEFHVAKRVTIIPADALRTNHWSMEVSAVRLGEIVLANLPGEIFSQTGVALREALVARKIGGAAMVTELAGPYATYVSPAGQYGAGGYEDTCCFLREGSAEKLVEQAVDAARLLFGRR